MLDGAETQEQRVASYMKEEVEDFAAADEVAVPRTGSLDALMRRYV
jgi:hypothetical protein